MTCNKEMKMESKKNKYENLPVGLPVQHVLVMHIQHIHGTDIGPASYNPFGSIQPIPSTASAREREGGPGNKVGESLYRKKVDTLLNN